MIPKYYRSPILTCACEYLRRVLENLWEFHTTGSSHFTGVVYSTPSPAQDRFRVSADAYLSRTYALSRVVYESHVVSSFILRIPLEEMLLYYICNAYFYPVYMPLLNTCVPEGLRKRHTCETAEIVLCCMHIIMTIIILSTLYYDIPAAESRLN